MSSGGWKSVTKTNTKKRVSHTSHKPSNINNDSGVVGTTVKDALNTLNGTVLNAITSTAAGDEKKIISMTYNPTTGLITVNYEA